LHFLTSPGLPSQSEAAGAWHLRTPEQQQQQPDAAAAGQHSWLDTATVFQHLSTQHMGRVLLSTPSIPSTQEFMRLHSSVAPDGTVLVADQQTQGKGVFSS
jgi:hypothetical protein